MRLRQVAAAAVACALLCLPFAGPADAAPDQASTGAQFAVSTSSDPLVPDARGVVRTFITLANTGAQALRVTLRSVGIRPLDDGQVQILDQPDPTWGPAAKLPSEVTLPPRSYRRLPLSVTVPAGLPPDLYLLGYLAEAIPERPAANAVVVRNQISALITVELPGARPRRLELDADAGGFLHFASELTGTFRVHNTGVAAALFRGQVRIDSAFGGSNLAVVQPQVRKQLLPAGTSRTITYRWKTSRLWQLLRPTVEVAYNNDTAAPQTVVDVGRPILLLPVRTAILAAGLLAVMVGLLAYVVMRRSKRRHGRRRAPTGRRVLWARRRQPIPVPPLGGA